MKFMPIVVSVLVTVIERLLKWLKNLEIIWQMDTIQILLRTARMLKRVLQIWGDLLSLGLQWKDKYLGSHFGKIYSTSYNRPGKKQMEQKIRKLMTTQKALHPKYDIVHMLQEKKYEVDSPALKIASIRGLGLHEIEYRKTNHTNQ